MEKVTSNKKLIIAGIIAALCLAVVAGFASMAINNADAEDSPVAPVVVVDGFQFQVTDVVPAGKEVNLAKSTSQASNVPAGVTPLANFVATTAATSATLTFAYENAAAVAGQAVKVYVQHNDGKTEVLEGTFSNAGTVTFQNVGFSVFSLVTTLNENTSNTSPKTGIYS